FLVVSTSASAPKAKGTNASTQSATEAAPVQLVDGRLEVQLGDVAVGQLVEIRFRARLSANAIGGTGTINNALVSAENLREGRRSSDAIVISDPIGIVYAGASGGAIKISGARVVVSTDQIGEHPISLVTSSGIAPNGGNANPFITSSDGNFNFALSLSQVGSEVQPATYFINVLASGFHRRLLEATIRPSEHDLYNVTVRAIDDQPIAEGGSFMLTREAVQLNGLAVLVLNIPVFETASFELSKTADRQRADIGDVVSYRVVAHNALVSPIREIVMRDRLPASFHYVPGTARIDAAVGAPRVVEPEIAGNELLFRLGQLGAGETITVVYRVRIGANAAIGEQFNAASAAGVLSSTEKVSTGTARAGVVIGRGIFGMQRAIIGRVFADVNGNGKFDDGESPISNARLYLNNGDSVTTDSQGMYNFPFVNEGSVTIALDPISVVRGYKLLDDGGRTTGSWTKLLRTPLGGGALLRQNFALLSSETKGGDGRIKPEYKVEPLTNLSLPNPSLSPTPLPAGTYELPAGDDVVPVAPGEARIDSPGLNQVILSAAMRLDVTVAEGWTVVAEVNGEKLSGTRIGEQRIDHKNKISSFAFIGINVRAGMNRVAVTPISPQGKAGSTTESGVYGRGPVRRLEIVSEKKSLTANGRESTLVHIRAFDQWDHPAADDQVLIDVSSGVLTSEACGGNARNSPCTIPIEIPAEQASNHGGLTLGQSLPADSVVGRRDGQLDAATRQQKLTLSGGEGRVYLISGNAPGNVELQAQMGQIEAHASVSLLPEMRSAILVGMAEATFGRAAPDRESQGIRGSMSSRISFFYRGTIFDNNLLTLAYDSHRPFHRSAGRDRLYELDPLDRAYSVFGDSSTRFEEARSNSKVYARLDRGPSFLMFGDFNPDLDATNINGPAIMRSTGTRMLTGYSRNLTGVKLHVENRNGDSVTLTGARPNTSFARDVFPGSSFGFLQLSQTQVLQGSENVMLEVRDRRNPEIIISREPFARSIDYNLDVNAGAIFLLRPVSSFDYQLNLLQIVVTYEYSVQSLASAVYTGRASRQFTMLGLRVGATLVNQRQPEQGPFYLGGLDFEKSLPRGGKLLLELGMSRGRLAVGSNLLSTNQVNGNHDGQAYRVELNQPLPFLEGTLKASVTQADAGFLNPFGATVAPGSRRAVAIIDLKLRPSSILHFGLGEERNKSDTVDNERLTGSVAWTEQLTSRLRITAGYDFRNLSGTSLNDISSQLLTVGGEWRATEKLTLAAKREQNLGEADPTYPDQTTLSAGYQVNPLTRLFFTQRLASDPIVPISDVSNTGFAATGARNEMAFGVETRLGRFTTINSRYQIENGINGTDSYAVIGFANRLPIRDTLSLEFGIERGQHLTGADPSFNGANFGFSWLPTKNFRSVVRYELRDHNGFGQAISIGAAGKLGDDITTLASYQLARTEFAGQSNSTTSGTAALAFRPFHSDRAALLLSLNRRSTILEGGPGVTATFNRADTLSTDGLFSLTKQLEFYGRVAVKSGGDGQPGLAPVSTLTYMAQGRLQNRFSQHFDVATEFRWLAQPVTRTARRSMGTEFGYWLLPDLRLGIGYNFTGVREPLGDVAPGQSKRGFYFTISSKLSNLFNLFGTPANAMETTGSGESKEKRK
ncbi:MAG: large repetitive protein, partial [Blastocatellia bacterium]|nr:large repetitive protein [Blastocatellia bacterium]